ncbi:MAG: hypothetical protein U0354_11165 [Candidatus Sericytochromatia bacterium]
MGSIQALRSWALSSRANEDTDVQISGFLGNVNKALGKQIVSILDQLQGVVGERTKAYNNLVSSINRTIDGKGGIAEKAILGSFAGMKTIFMIPKIVMGKFTASDLINFATSAISNGLKKAEIDASIGGAIYDYEKMASQLGYATFRVTSGSINSDASSELGPGMLEQSGLITGASRFLDMRDALMPRYNYQQTNLASPGSYAYHSKKGFVGTLRRN